MGIKGGMYLQENHASGSVMDYSHWSIPRTKNASCQCWNRNMVVWIRLNNSCSLVILAAITWSFDVICWWMLQPSGRSEDQSHLRAGHRVCFLRAGKFPWSWRFFNAKPFKYTQQANIEAAISRCIRVWASQVETSPKLGKTDLVFPWVCPCDQPAEAMVNHPKEVDHEGKTRPCCVVSCGLMTRTSNSPWCAMNSGLLLGTWVILLIPLPRVASLWLVMGNLQPGLSAPVPLVQHWRPSRLSPKATLHIWEWSLLLRSFRCGGRNDGCWC